MLFGKSYAWKAPPGFLEKWKYVPREVLAEMGGRGHKAARRASFEARGTVATLTVVDPGGRELDASAMRYWLAAFARIVSCISGMSPPARPPSLETTLYLSGLRKRLSPSDAEISPANANTGVTVRYHTTGKAEVLVYRREEALKTLAHEVLHAYDFADWAAGDRSLADLARSAASSAGVVLISSEALKPHEALVDAAAIRITQALFGGRTWEECVAHAERLRDRLVSRCRAQGGNWRQSTAAFEYFCLKPAFMRALGGLLGGSSLPGREAVLSTLLAGSSGRREPRGGAARWSGGDVRLRMTPSGLADG